MAKDILHTKMCDELGIEYPIMQAGMSDAAGPKLCAAVSEAGGLGLLGTLHGSTDLLRDDIRKVKELTNKPFAVTLGVAPQFFGKELTEDELRESIPKENREFISNLKKELNLPDPKVMLPLRERRSMAGISGCTPALLDVLCEEHVSHVVTIMGKPPDDFVHKAHDHGMKVISYIGIVKHARYCEQVGADFVVATGRDAGGHVGRIGTLALVPQVVDAVSIPVIAGGGIMDGRGLVATLALGAVGVNMGTRFLLSPEVRYISSPFSFARGEVPKEDFRENIKKRYVEANEDQTTLTEGIAGGIERMTLGNWPPLWKRPNAPKPLALPYQMYSIEPLTRAAYETGRYDLISTGIGQGVGMLKEEMKAGDIVRKVIEEAREVLARLQA